MSILSEKEQEALKTLPRNKLSADQVEALRNQLLKNKKSKTHAEKLLDHLNKIKTLGEEKKEENLVPIPEEIIKSYIKTLLNQNPYITVDVQFDFNNPLIRSLPRFFDYINNLRKSGVKI